MIYIIKHANTSFPVYINIFFYIRVLIKKYYKRLQLLDFFKLIGQDWNCYNLLFFNFADMVIFGIIFVYFVSSTN